MKQKIEFDSMFFNGGEPHVKITDESVKAISGSGVKIVQRISCLDDLGKLFVLTDAIRRCRPHSLAVVIPYFPGARQDRVANPGEALTAKVYADLINSQKFDVVIIGDPHSDVTPALINNVYVVTLANILGELTYENVLDDSMSIIIPDAGATKRILACPRFNGMETIQCTKNRDTKTGKLTGAIVHNGDLIGKKCLIVDDICDGGRTFEALAKELKKQGATRVCLYVTHGIFSQGVIPLLSNLDHIITTNAFKQNYLNLDNFTVLNSFSEDGAYII